MIIVETIKCPNCAEYTPQDLPFCQSCGVYFDVDDTEEVKNNENRQEDSR